MSGALRVAVACSAALSLLACSAEDGNTSRDLGPRGVAGTRATTGSGGGTATKPPDGFGNTTNMPKPAMPAPGGQTGADICEKAHVTADPQTPDMMIVLDRSGSMKETRWAPSVSALRVATMKLQSQIRFGMAMFPDPMANGGALDCLLAPDLNACLNSITCGKGRVVVEPALDNAMAIDTALGNTMPNGGTPTPETLQALVDTYAAPSTDPDALPTPKYVLLVTDGQPTCPNGGGDDVTQPDIDASNAAIEALAAKGVRTYVIGYDTNTPGNEMLKAVLDGFAQRGGTGDTEHHPVEDEASLLAVLESITGKVASCTFVLEAAPADPTFVRVTLDGHQVNLGEADGWELVGDKTVELKGSSCMALMTPSAHSVDVEVECEAVPPS